MSAKPNGLVRTFPQFAQHPVENAISHKRAPITRRPPTIMAALAKSRMAAQLEQSKQTEQKILALKNQFTGTNASFEEQQSMQAKPNQNSWTPPLPPTIGFKSAGLSLPAPSAPPLPPAIGFKTAPPTPPVQPHHAQQRQSQSIEPARVFKNRIDNTRSTLTESGEVIGGYEDFKSGSDIITLSPPPLTTSATGSGKVQQASVHVPYVLLTDWRPLTEVVSLWRYFLKSHPDLKSVFVLDCGAGGDCLFHVVAAGYNHLFQSLMFHMEGMRLVAANQAATLSESLTNEFLIDLFGRIPEQCKSWPHAKKSQYLKSIIQKPGNTYWGETGTLRQLLLKSPPFLQHKIGFVVINIRVKPIAFRPPTDSEINICEKAGRKPPKEIASQHGPRAEFTIIRLVDTKYFMFLHCLDNSHWILVGYAPATLVPTLTPTDARVASTFDINSFPRPLHPFIQEK